MSRLAPTLPPAAEKEARFTLNLAGRQRWGRLGELLFAGATVVALVALVTLLATVANNAFGLVAWQYEVEPATLADRPLQELEKERLVELLQAHVSKGRFRRFEHDQPFATRSRENVLQLLMENVVKPRPAAVWPLSEALFRRGEIEAEVAEKYPGSWLEFRAWVNLHFLTSTMSSDPVQAGIRTALLGSLWMIVITALLAFPIGVGAAIYLEEYAVDNRFNRMLQANINNLAGVPSIIYGILGLAIFVRALAPLTSGALFGVEDGNGRTLLAAALTMTILSLPIIIISAQEAIRAVPGSLRLASYGLGATKWQTIWYHVLPAALPGILTGTILAISRAIGETAPLIVVGAATFIQSDPSGPFSKFTALPIQIYTWTTRPQDEFRLIAAAAILVLLALLLTMNATAVLLRNRLARRS